VPKSSVKNVLVILCDQLRKDCLGCYGNAYIRTPHIDSLARRGVRFTRNYVANPICMPNRLSLLSGMFPANHGLWTNGLLVKDEGATLMHHLAAAGCQTASIGKIHFEPTDCAADAGSCESFDRWRTKPDMEGFHGPFWGFEYVELQDGHGSVEQHMRPWFVERGGRDDMLVPDANGVHELPNHLNSSAFVGERTVNYLRGVRDADRPFFLVASFPDPHAPFIAGRESVAGRSGDDVVMPVGSPEDLAERPAHYRQHLDGAWHRSGARQPAHPGGIPEALCRKRIALTYAMIEQIDVNVGAILGALEEQGLADDTAVIFTSDHGELLGDHGLWHKGPFFYEGLINTPLIVAMPGHARGAVISDALVSAVDLAPTICDALGVSAPFYVDGISQLPVIDGASAQLRHSCLLEYRNGYSEKDCCTKALITRTHKYIRYQTGERELTDLQNDPVETYNVSGQPAYADVEAQLADGLLTLLLQTQSKKPIQISLA